MNYLYIQYILVYILITNKKVYFLKNGHFTFVPTKDKQIITTIKIGQPSQNFKVLLDSSSIYLYLFPENSNSTMKPLISNFYYCSLSSTCTELKSNYSSDFITYNISGKSYSDTLTIADMNIKNFSFILVNTSDYIHQINKENNISGILGIGNFINKISDNTLSYSILDSLYNNKCIDSKIFYIKFINEKKGKFYFGIKNKIYTNEYNGSCVPEYNFNYSNKISCIPNKIQVGNYDLDNLHTYDKIIPISFDTSSNENLVPEHFFVFLVNQSIYHLIKNGKCKYIYEFVNNKNYTRIHCHNLYSNDFEDNIYYTFNKHLMIFDESNMFNYIQKINDTKYYRFNIITYRGNIKEFVFGQSFLKDFSLQFDKKNNLISFHSFDYIINLESKFLYLFIFTLIVGIVVFLIFLLTYYYIFYFKNKKKLNFESFYIKNKDSIKNDDIKKQLFENDLSKTISIVPNSTIKNSNIIY